MSFQVGIGSLGVTVFSSWTLSSSANSDCKSHNSARHITEEKQIIGLNLFSKTDTKIQILKNVALKNFS